MACVLVEEWFFKFGVPGGIHFDQGRNSESNLIQQLCSLYQVDKSHSTPYHPASNGQCDWASCLHFVHIIIFFSLSQINFVILFVLFLWRLNSILCVLLVFILPNILICVVVCLFRL